jgi:hypothetical protein
MIRRMLFAMLFSASLTTALLANQPATIVLNSGERISGNLSYDGGGELRLNVNGQERTVPLTDIAIVAFQSGDPSAAELQQLPMSDNPPELQRNLVVLRDGSVVRGKMYKFSPTGDSITIDTGAGDRREIPSERVARVYMSVGGARNLYADVVRDASRTTIGTSGVAVAGTQVTVPATQAWTDTGINVKKGDRLSFHTTGQVNIAPGGNEAVAGPDGAATDIGSRAGYPVAAMPAGGLVARVGNRGAAFPVGSNSQPITMPADGRLFLGVNDNNYSDNSGAFTVTIAR